MSAPAMVVRRRPLQPGGLSGSRDIPWDRRLGGMLIADVTKVYLDIVGSIEKLEGGLNNFTAAYKGFKKNLTNLAISEFSKKIGFGLGTAVSATVGAANAVVQAVEAAKKEGIDWQKSKDAFFAIADSLRHSDMALEAFRKLKVVDLVNAKIVEGSAVGPLLWKLNKLDVAMTITLEEFAIAWSKKYGSILNPAELTLASNRYRAAYTRVKGKLAALAEVMGLTGQYKLVDWSLMARIKDKILSGMSDAAAKVRENHKPDGWLASTFNSVVDFLLVAPKLIAFVIVGPVFNIFMGPVMKMDAGMSRVAFAAGRLISASATVAAFGVKAYTGEFSVARVEEKKTEKEAEAQATQALEKAVAEAGKREYEMAARDIENYNNYAKAVQERMEAFLAGLLGILKWIALGAGVLIIGGLIIYKRVL